MKRVKKFDRHDNSWKTIWRRKRNASLHEEWMWDGATWDETLEKIFGNYTGGRSGMRGSLEKRDPKANQVLNPCLRIVEI